MKKVFVLAFVAVLVAITCVVLSKLTVAIADGDCGEPLGVGA